MIEKGKCPLCGKENACAAVQGTDPLKCWCMTANVPKALLTQVPEKYRRQSCVCQSCVEAFKKKVSI